MTDSNKKNCISDADCDINNICAFNDDDLSHYCINNNIDNLYYGCVNKDLSTMESIESKTKSEHLNYKNCINFARRQVNTDSLEYNYMIFKPKKNAYVDTTTINIYLKCDNQILATIPYNDYFDIKCDETQENCILESKESLHNFIIQNTTNCKNQIYLEIIYECENEGLKKNIKIPIDIDNYKSVKVNLICPVDDNNDKFKSKCEALFINNDVNNYVDTKKSLYDCKNPLYKVPIVTNNINNYKKIKNKNSQIEIKDYDNKINAKLEDLKKLEAEKYIILKKIQTGHIISFEDAYNEINKYSINNPKEKWKIYTNYDAVQNLLHDYEMNDNVLKYYGLVYTIEDAIKIANDNNENLFVWYHNTFELNNYASKLYFINIYNINEELLSKNNWVKNENVTTGILKIQIENFEDETNNDNNYILEEQIYESNELKNKYLNLINQNLNTKDINYYVLKNLNDKITTYGQAISMNNYETNINNNILIALSIILAIVGGVFIALLIYFNYLTNGKISIFAPPTKPP